MMVGSVAPDMMTRSFLSTVPSLRILSCSRISPYSSASGRGGQPDTYTSTGTILSTPCRTLYVGNGPPALEQLPIEITHFGSGIWSYRRRSTGAIFLVTVPATIIRSDCRGDARKTSAPNRAMSKRDADAAIISIAQHARPNPIGQIDDSRAQLRTRSMLVVMKLSSNL